MAGIDTDGPGFQRIIIHPRTGGGIKYVKASYDSIHGRIATHWQQGPGRFQLEVTIPANTTATVYVPAKDASSVTESGKPAGDAPGVKLLRWAVDHVGDGSQQSLAPVQGSAVYQIGSGTYKFVSWPSSFVPMKSAVGGTERATLFARVAATVATVCGEQRGWAGK